MKAFLIFLAVGGAILYGLLEFTHDALQDGKAENSLAVQTQSSHPAAQQLSSWDTYLHDRAPSQKPETPLATSQLTAALPTQPSPGQSSEPKSVVDPQFVASEDKAPTIESDSAGQEPERAKVVLAAALHSEGSVSSPTSRIYPPGKELLVVGRADGWFQVSDPVTQERGWIFEKYLSSVDSPSLTQASMDSTTTEPLQTKPALQKSKKHIRSAKSAVRVVAQSVERGVRPRGLFTFRPFTRFAARRANSPFLFAGPQ
jgi:hypothetical protein